MTFNVQDIARRFAVSTSTVSAWIANGELPAVNVSRSPSSLKPRWRISEQSLSEFEQRRASSPSPAPRATTRRRAAGDDSIIKFY